MFRRRLSPKEIQRKIEEAHEAALDRYKKEGRNLIEEIVKDLDGKYDIDPVASVLTRKNYNSQVAITGIILSYEHDFSRITLKNTITGRPVIPPSDKPREEALKIAVEEYKSRAKSDPRYPILPKVSFTAEELYIVYW